MPAAVELPLLSCIKSKPRVARYFKPSIPGIFTSPYNELYVEYPLLWLNHSSFNPSTTLLVMVNWSSNGILMDLFNVPSALYGSEIGDKLNTPYNPIWF